MNGATVLPRRLRGLYLDLLAQGFVPNEMDWLEDSANAITHLSLLVEMLWEDFATCTLEEYVGDSANTNPEFALLRQIVGDS